MKTTDFDFVVPRELIANEPAEKRDHSRLLVLNRKTHAIEHKHFYNIIDYLFPGDLLVMNDTKVIPGNLVGVKEEGGARVEVLLVSRKPCLPAGRQLAVSGKQTWECLVRPGKRLKIGSKVIFGKNEVVGTVLEKTESGEQIIEFEGDLHGFMKKNGEIPLPPYITSNIKHQTSKQITNPCLPAGTAKAQLEKRYQTVYAQKEGASAAPTAGLHFTPDLIKSIENKGIKVAYVTLHTGLATFKPVYSEKVEDHKMYSEHFEVPAETLEAFKSAKRVVAVGTTSVRTLETLAQSRTGLPNNRIIGSTDLFIYPGYRFKAVDAMITNFHWPRTTLIMLVSAFAGKDYIMKAYQEAIDKRYRFFSFGDAMLII